jgi:hypothetical protein
MTYPFSLRKRWRVLAPVLWVEAGLLALLAWRGGWNWRTGVVATVVVLLALRVATYLLGARRPLVLDAGVLSRGGQSVSLPSAQVELRTLPHQKQLRPNEVVVRSGKQAVSFDVSLERFDEAIRELVGLVGAERVSVTAPGEPDLRDSRRDEVLSAVRGERSG